ncbi:MAG TPA: hypothetical protein VMT37_03625 [Solirubrobacterales bacterium]|nr:hypothetical protein [Solirubrobacterales bacterium]
MLRNYLGSWLLLATLLVTGVIACGGGGQSSSENTEAQPTRNRSTHPGPKPTHPAEVSTGTPIPTTILVNEYGFALYSDGNDAKDSGQSSCYGACERQWRPYLTAGQPVPWQGKEAVAKNLLGTIQRSDGTEQVTYDGYPLYLLKGEATAKANGIGRSSFGATWFAVEPDGSRLGHL